MVGLFEQRLREALKAASKREAEHIEKDPKEKRKTARSHYLKRKRTKEIRDYVNNNKVIKYKDIEQIQSKYGI